MKAVVEPSGQALVEFETEEELRTEYERNLSAGGLCFPAEVEIEEFTPIKLTLKLAGGGKLTVSATVVRVLEGALAVSIEANPENILSALNVKPEPDKGSEKESEKDSDKDSEKESEQEQSTWERVRGLTRTEKLMLAPKADRSERAVLCQDSDAQVLFYLLKNPRITVEEVVRIARSPLLSTATADLIAKTTQWSASPEIRIALVGNPRTPTPLALRLLPTLPESEIRQIAKGGAVNQALKQAALRLIVNRS